MLDRLIKYIPHILRCVAQHSNADRLLIANLLVEFRWWLCVVSMSISMTPYLWSIHLSRIYFCICFTLCGKKEAILSDGMTLADKLKLKLKKNMQMNNAQNKLNDRLREINFKNRRKHTYTTLTEHVCLTMTLFIHTHTQFIQFNRIELSAPLIATLCCCCCWCFFFFRLLCK